MYMENEIYSKTRIIYNDEQINKIRKASIVICGIGGVGSYALEALVRIGVENICIIDKDIIEITNKNRQLIALDSTVGMDKVEVAKKRCIDINSKINILAIKDNIDESNIDILINNFNIKCNYIVDCVDNVSAKIAIIEYSKNNSIKCISSMGFANKVEPLKIKIDDIYNTSVCPLAKILRKKLKSKGITDQKVVYSTEVPVKVNGGELGSVSFVPSVAGLVIAGEVVNDIILS